MPTPSARLGERGERVAREYLKSRGYEIVTTNFRCPYGEVDIIARKGDCLVFVEVRTRRSPGWFGTPEESLSKRKRERLVTTAETYIQACASPPEEWRIDLIAIRLDGRGAFWPVEHIENAIQLG